MGWEDLCGSIGATAPPHVAPPFPSIKPKGMLLNEKIDITTNNVSISNNDNDNKKVATKGQKDTFPNKGNGWKVNMYMGTLHASCIRPKIVANVKKIGTSLSNLGALPLSSSSANV